MAALTMAWIDSYCTVAWRWVKPLLAIADKEGEGGQANADNH